MEQQPTGKFNTKKALTVTLLTLVFVSGAAGVIFLINQNNNQKAEIDRLNKDIASVKKEITSTKKSESQPKSTESEPTAETQIKTKEHIAGVNYEYKIDVPADWRVERKTGGEGRFSLNELTITTSSGRKIILSAEVNPPIGGAGGDDRPITVEKLADTGIDEYKVLQLTSDNGEQEIIVMAAKGGYGRLASGAWYRSFNKAISFQDNGNNHLIQFYVNGDTRNFSEQEKSEIAKAMSSFARR